MWLLLQASGAAAHELPGGYGASLLQSMLALAAVCILAWIVLRWSAQRGLGLGADRRVKVLERVPLDARRWVYLVRIGERVLVLGAGDGASPTLLAELRPDEVPEAPPQRSFLEVLRARGAADGKTVGTTEPAASVPTVAPEPEAHRDAD